MLFSSVLINNTRLLIRSNAFELNTEARRWEDHYFATIGEVDGIIRQIDLQVADIIQLTSSIETSINFAGKQCERL